MDNAAPPIVRVTFRLSVISDSASRAFHINEVEVPVPTYRQFTWQVRVMLLYFTIESLTYGMHCMPDYIVTARSVFISNVTCLIMQTILEMTFFTSRYY